MESPNLSHVAILPLSTLGDAEVKMALTKHRIGLTVEEARKISTFLGRDPTIVEATIWGIQGSEHCSYKSSRRFLKNFPTSNRHVILGPKEDSGIVAITDGPPGKRWGLVISHESHNHPSQIVPFEGAATGVGGTVRDVGCMGARVIGCMDMLRLGDLKTEETRSIANEVARGIAGYGNPLGVPNLGGDTVFDTGFNTNCLVNAIAVGIVREDEVIHSYVPDEAAKEGYDIIIVGKPTDRSGFGGASFASVTMDETEKEQNTGAVQEPNPFLERHLLASTYALFDWLTETGNLHRISFKDLGAGGVVCSSVEQVAEKDFGANIDLGRVHVSLKDLPPEVIACAETQERFCWMCHPSLTQTILDHYNKDWDLPGIAQNAGASVIGKVTEGGMYRLTYKGNVVCEARSQDITLGLQYERPTKSSESSLHEPSIDSEGASITLKNDLLDQPYVTTIEAVFRAMLAHPNYASPSAILRHYDKSVIGNSIIEAGEADAGVIAPLQDLQSYVHRGAHSSWTIAEAERWTGVALAADGNPRYGKISAFAQGAMAAVEACCNVAAVGAHPRAVTDCLNYGNAENPTHLSALEQGVKGIAEAARGLGTETDPVAVISGNVSLYNCTPDGKAIPPSAIVCAIGVMPDARTAIGTQVTDPDAVILLLGDPKDECGGSAFYQVLEHMASLPADTLLGNNVPHPDYPSLRSMIDFLIASIGRGDISACHDISDGGIALALFEMLVPRRRVGGDIGLDIVLDEVSEKLGNSTVLFSQTPGFVLACSISAARALEERAESEGISVRRIGTATRDPQLRVRRNGNVLLQTNMAELLDIWNAGLATALRGDDQ